MWTTVRHERPRATREFACRNLEESLMQILIRAAVLGLLFVLSICAASPSQAQVAAPAGEQILLRKSDGALAQDAGLGSFTMRTPGKPDRTLKVTARDGLKVTKFKVEGPWGFYEYCWSEDYRHYYINGYIQHFYEFSRNGSGGYDFKQKTTAGNTLSSGTMTQNP